MEKGGGGDWNERKEKKRGSIEGLICVGKKPAMHKFGLAASCGAELFCVSACIKLTSRFNGDFHSPLQTCVDLTIL